VIYAIIGSRDFTAKWKVANWIKNNLSPSDTVISGGARGPDKIAAHYARLHGATVIEILPDYPAHGPQRAPLVRNIKIVKQVDKVIAFWDGVSTGTLHAITYAVQYGKEVLIIP